MRRIALVTDFGTRDPYVAEMKGVIAGRTTAPIIDLSHEIAPFDAWEAAFFLREAVPWWPPETIFVVVVDRGVGSARRILAVEAEERIFLAPDNGTLHFVEGRAHSVERDTFFLPKGSTTFHGRDRFAPVAAAIANGTPLREVGPPVDDRVRLNYRPPDATRGTIVRIDRFGNVITDIPGRADARATSVLVHGHSISRWSTTYSGDGPFLVIGSTGCIEISVAGASAAALLQLQRGESVEIISP